MSIVSKQIYFYIKDVHKAEVKLVLCQVFYVLLQNFHKAFHVA